MATKLVKDLEVNPRNVVNIIAATRLKDGRIAILDSEGITVLSAAGEPLARWAGKGAAPGQMSTPVALTSVGDYVVVLQAVSSGNTLSVYNAANGRPIRVAGPPVAGGDWTSYTFRGPALFSDFPKPSGVEDWARRLRPFDDTSFVLVVQSPEKARSGKSRQVAKGPIYLIRLTLAGDVLDTLAVLPAPESELRNPGGERRPTTYWEPLFAARPLWITGRGWWASMGPNDSSLLVRHHDGRLTRISWANTHLPVTTDDKVAASRYAVVYVLRASPASGLRSPAFTGPRRRTAYKLFLQFFHFADSQPIVTSLLSVGQCLLLSPFAPQDYIDGTATVFLRFDITVGQLIDVVAIVSKDVRVLYADESGVYGRVYDADNLPALVRWRLPDTRCG